MSPSCPSRPGHVDIVGAGPGDPDLITVRGLRCLRQAQVVVYDRLIAASLLDEAPTSADRINVGKAPGHHLWSQTNINALLVDQASQGKRVVRLKGGDPFVFGRGGEECEALRAAGIPFTVVPGVSSATAVPAYAGIPVTHRDYASTFTVVTGHTCDPGTSVLDWRLLAQTETLIILMGMRHLPTIVQQLITHGRALDTPVAVIHWGTTAEQVVVDGTLADIAEKALGLPSPATIVVGHVVALRPMLDWFDPESAIPQTRPVGSSWSSAVASSMTSV